MLVSFIAYMPRQCRRESLPVATEWEAASSSALYFGGCIGTSPVCAKACEAVAATATAPVATRNSRRSMVFSSMFKLVHSLWRRHISCNSGAEADLNHIDFV